MGPSLPGTRTPLVLQTSSRDMKGHFSDREGNGAGAGGGVVPTTYSLDSLEYPASLELQGGDLEGDPSRDFLVLLGGLRCT